MTSARLARAPSHTTAVFVRVLAAFVALATVAFVPWALADAALGHIAFRSAGIAAAVALGLTAVTTMAARSFNPLRH